MEINENLEEVNQTNTLTPYNLPDIQDIKRELCDEDLTSRLDKYDDLDFDPFHEKIFRTLSANFNRNGLTKSTLKGPPNPCVFLKYRDIDDAFVDMVISDSVSKFKNNKCPPKKIDLKHFKDNFFSFDFNDYEDPQSQNSDSESETVCESESFIEPSQSEADIHDVYNSDIESNITEDTDLLSLDNFTNSGYSRHVRLEKLNNDTNTSKSTDSSLSPLKGTVRDVRIMVEKLQCNLPDGNNFEAGNSLREISSKSCGTKIRQVAKKKTGGMVINSNLPESNDTESNKEPKSNQPSNEDNLVPDGFDKMTRSDRRKLEKIIAESRANLVSGSDGDLDNISFEKESDGTSTTVKESNSTSNEIEAASTSTETKSASTTDEKESNNRSNEKEEVDAACNEDKLNENELLKSVVKNTILDFLIKSKGLKLGKEKVDLISDEISKKLNSFIPDEDGGTDADDQASINAGIPSTDDNKVESLAPTKSNESNEDNISKKRPTPPKKRTTKRTTSAHTRKRLEEFQEIARDIINCELSTPLVDELEEPLRPNTRQSLGKNDKEVNVDDIPEEPRRPITRQSLAKNDKDKNLTGDENEELRKTTNRQPTTKTNTDTLDDVQEEPRRPVTRQSLTKNDKIGLPNELPKESKRQPNTTTKIPPAKNDKDVIMIRDEEAKKPTIRQIVKDVECVTVPDDDVLEEPRRPATRRFLAKNDKDIITIDLDKEEPKKIVTRKTVSELGRSRSLGSTLSSSLDSEIDEPIRRTTRQSLQKQKEEISKGSPECSVLTDELKPEITVSKRKNNARTKKNSSRKGGSKRRSHNKKIDVEAVSRDSSVVGIDTNEDSIISLSDSDTSKSSKIADSSVFSGHTILKASADSTTFETDPNDETEVTASDEKSHRSPNDSHNEFNVVKATDKDSSSLDSEITSNKSTIHVNSEKNLDEQHSRSESDKNYLADEGICLPDTSISVGSFSNWGNSDSGSDTSDDNLKNVSKLVEDLLDESIKDKLSQNQESTEGSPCKKPLNALLHPSNDKKVPQPVDEPFQILNDMITDIEERLLKEESEANKIRTEHELSKDIDKCSLPEKESINFPSVITEVSADSTSFLNYTMDDSFKLMIDEGTPQKETINEEDSPNQPSVEMENNSEKPEAETSAVLTNSSNDTCSIEELNKEAIVGSKQEVEKSGTEVSDLKEDDKKSEESEKAVEISHSELSSLKDVNKQPLIESKKETDVSSKEEIMSDKPEEKFTDQRINDKDTPSSNSIDQKLSSFCKPLTIEQKIAQLTKRDPRLVNDKKIPAITRDPRLRKNLPNVEKRENVSSVQIISVSKVNEEKVKLPEKLEPKIPETKLVEPLRMEHKPPESKHSEEKKKMNDQKSPEQKSSEQKLVVSKISEPKIVSSLPEASTVSLLKDLGGTSPQETDEKLLVQSQKTIKSLFDFNYEPNRKKRFKKAEIDEELLYKTPLSDLHDTQSERSTYEREKDYKKKKLFPEGRRVRIVTEERGKTISALRRVRTVDETTEERRDYNQATVASNSQSCFRRESQAQSNFARPNSEVSQLRADRRYSEEDRYSKETYEEKTFYSERKEIFPSGSSENYEQGSCIRRLVTETSYSETVHSRNNFQDNHIYSRREFYRRNRYTHDHDHLGNSSRLLENSSNIRNDNEIYPQHNNFPAIDEPTFNVSAYPPVSFLPEPMYSQEEDLDQSFGNMETESFSPPPSDICPPPPLIRSPTSELGRRDNYCPSPPRIGRRNSNEQREYEEFSRAYHRNYDSERGFRGRNNNCTRGQSSGNFRRGNGRDFHRRREESPPRKRFAGENFRGRDDDRVVRWRRSPSWSPERQRRWSRERSPLQREPHPWNSPREVIHPWNSPPREQHPWNSPPRNRSPSPPRRRDNYRDRSSYYHRY
ncbi:hypothetical protein O3M35_011574 [Rhynocoris fuscipes]|uniref:Uncharacterized protein n=1 Tax=Rhynocoris fuscipes TaxID=488301 RepID=A0AAW1D1Y8_9HEMI